MISRSGSHVFSLSWVPWFTCSLVPPSALAVSWGFLPRFRAFHISLTRCLHHLPRPRASAADVSNNLGPKQSQVRVNNSCPSPENCQRQFTSAVWVESKYVPDMMSDLVPLSDHDLSVLKNPYIPPCRKRVSRSSCPP